MDSSSGGGSGQVEKPAPRKTYEFASIIYYIWIYWPLTVLLDESIIYCPNPETCAQHVWVSCAENNMLVISCMNWQFHFLHFNLFESLWREQDDKWWFVVCVCSPGMHVIDSRCVIGFRRAIGMDSHWRYWLVRLRILMTILPRQANQHVQEEAGRYYCDVY